MTDAKKSTKRAAARAKSSEIWTDVEREAIQEAAQERKRSARRRPGDERAQGERDVRAKIAEMAAPDQVMAERIHALVSATAPGLVPRTWYGMPAYTKDGKVICFFKAASKYKERYASFGFDTAAKLDEGTFWPTSWALTGLTPAIENQIAALVKKAAS